MIYDVRLSVNNEFVDSKKFDFRGIVNDSYDFLENQIVSRLGDDGVFITIELSIDGTDGVARVEGYIENTDYFQYIIIYHDRMMGCVFAYRRENESWFVTD
jgi:hypothetical protein